MTFTIHKETPKDVLIPIGQGRRAIEKAIEAPRLETPNKRRLKLDKNRDADVETIRREDPGKQGPVGTDTQEAPPRSPGEDVKIGNGEEDDNGEE